MPHTHPFNSPLSGTTRVSRYQKVKSIWILLKQETVSGGGISWAVCKYAPRSRQITTPAPHHSVFYRPGALPAAQPTASKHWRPGFLMPLYSNMCVRLLTTSFRVMQLVTSSLRKCFYYSIQNNKFTRQFARQVTFSKQELVVFCTHYGKVWWRDSFLEFRIHGWPCCSIVF